MPSTSRAVRQLSDGNAVGTVLGTATSDLIGFYGNATGSTQPSVSGSVSSGAAASSLIFILNQLGLIATTNVAA